MPSVSTAFADSAQMVAMVKAICGHVKEIGRLCAENNIHVYQGGAGKKGLLGLLVKEALAGGGTVHSVVSEQIASAANGDILGNVIQVPSFEGRVRYFEEHCDVFGVLFGGDGTNKEIFTDIDTSEDERRSHRLPKVFMNSAGCYQALWNYVAVQSRLGMGRFMDPAQVAFESTPESFVSSLRRLTNG